MAFRTAERGANCPLQPVLSGSPGHSVQQSSRQTTLNEQNEVFDFPIDVWWAKPRTDPTEYAKEPWKHFREAHHAYLSIRLSKRDDFLANINPETRTRVDHEIERIQQTRAKFSSDENKKVLVQCLSDYRLAWKQEVAARMSEYKDETEKGERRETEDAERFRDEAKLLNQVSPELQELTNKANECDRHKKKYQRGREVLERVSRAISSGTWIEQEQTNESLPTTKSEDLYDLKAGVIYLKRTNPGSDWLGHTVDCPLLGESKFPNQKIMVNDILNATEENPLMSPCDKDTIRWFHFPSNNMEWIEKAIAKYYCEEPKEFNDFQPYDQVSRAEKLLSREYWRGQMHGTGTKGPLGHEASIKGPIHARHMRSRCLIVPRDPPHNQAETRTARSNSDAYSSRNPNGKNLAFFLPYLHWETSSRRAKMVDVVNEVTKTKDNKKHMSTVVTQLSAKTKTIPTSSHPTSTSPTNSQRRRCLGKYLMKISEVADQMDYAADERLLRENINRDPPLHIRRTLDQYYFLTLEDTSERDRDQVVYRGTKAGLSFHTRNTRVVMVDQLWLWILDDNTIITSFPRRWGRNKPDPSGVHKSLRERLKEMTQRKEGIKSIHHLAVVIIDQCSRVFFDRTKALDERPEVMDLFSSTIGHITQYASIAYDGFWRHSRLHSMGMLPDNNYKYLDINPEGVLLQEAQDIAEELKIMLRIYTEQGAVIKSFRRHLGQLNGELKGDVAIMHRLIEAVEKYHPGEHLQMDQRALDLRQRPQRQSWLDDTIDHVDILLEEIQNRKMEIQELEESALRTQHQLEGLLQLKQQQASIIEAKAALKRQEESIRQGRAIMAFTIVTIFFLPLGFFAAFFGMNNNDINDAKWMSLNEQITYMFGVSALVIAISVGLAFSPWTRALIAMLVKVPLVDAVMWR
ncbi:hypothetical protein QQX98_008766 [Neonectria punicea]|uniref:Ankyrin repeat protein n=1 Tax=Neonectria punicea TaxID=979145 RepID=A0ABR1GU90_9HYPO